MTSLVLQTVSGPQPTDGTSWVSRWCQWVTGRSNVMLGSHDPRVPLQIDPRRPWHRDFLTWCLANNEKVKSRQWMERTHEKSGTVYWTLGGEIAFHSLDGVFFTTMDNRRVPGLAKVQAAMPHRDAAALAITVKASLLGVE